MNKYDIIIVGMGPSSIFCAYELLQLKTKKKILLIEKGYRIEDRICPISNIDKCKKCKPICNIIGGFSGTGAFLDGKLLLYHLSSYNKNENELYIGSKEDSYIKKYFTKDDIKKYIEYTDNIYLKFGASKNINGIDKPKDIRKLQIKSSKNVISLIDVPVRHLGTEKAHELFKKLQDYLEDKIDMMFETEVTDLIIKNNTIKGVITSKGKILSDKVIIASGVSGSSWLEQMSKKYNIETRTGYIDIGIRYELKDDVMNEINTLMYEGKFIGRTKPYFDKVRTHCQNPSGFVTPETYDNGCTLVNGYSYKDKKSDNTNVAILVSYKLDDLFNSSIEYCFNIAKNANLISGGNPIVQRIGDLFDGRATTKYDLLNNSVKPSLTSAYTGDLSLVLDYRTITNIVNFIKKMNHIIPGFKNRENLMYGPEIKFYSNELVLNENLETSIKNLHSIGAGGGLTTGLMLASVSGVMLARKLENKE